MKVISEREDSQSTVVNLPRTQNWCGRVLEKLTPSHATCNEWGHIAALTIITAAECLLKASVLVGLGIGALVYAGINPSSILLTLPLVTILYGSIHIITGLAFEHLREIADQKFLA
ncbi:MAG: hypothetical protein NTX49_08880 [Chlamydiae bacterium]|nr:hypothetical protein [Chlamydiota bacterium]